MSELQILCTSPFGRNSHSERQTSNVGFLTPGFRIIEPLKTLTLQNQKLRAARDLLLPKLMNGEIVVRDA